MNNFICTHCGYSLTIKKSSNIVVIKITTPIEFINSLKNKELVEYDIIFSKDILETYLNTHKKKYDKVSILKSFDDITSQTRTVVKYILKCSSSCGTEFPLEPQTTIYSLNFKKQQTSFDNSNIELYLKDPTLPRTKDYICPNSKCETNIKNFDMSKKEAVFYRASGSYHLKYACSNCNHSWLN
jgi:hypothetical protein